MSTWYPDNAESIGRTPLVRLNRVLDGSRPASPAVVAFVGQTRAVLPQFAEFISLSGSKTHVQIFQRRAVVRLELRPGQLADAGQQPVLQ